MKLNNRFIFGILSLLLAAVIAFVALPTIARQTNGKEEIVRITQPVLKGEQISSENAEMVEVSVKDWLYQNFKREDKEYVKREYEIATELGKLMRAIDPAMRQGIVFKVLYYRYASDLPTLRLQLHRKDRLRQRLWQRRK